MDNATSYNRRNLELRVAEFYVSIRRPENAWRSLDDLEPQLNEINHRIRAGDYNVAAGVLECIDYHYLYFWGHYRYLYDLRERLVDYLITPKMQIANLIGLGRVSRILGQTDRAIQHLELALKLARRSKDPYSECEALYQLGFVYRNLGQTQRAVCYFEDSLRLVYLLGDTALEIPRLGSLSWFYLESGQFALASKVVKKALATARQVNNRWEESVNLTRLGHVYYAFDQPDRAMESYAQALKIARETDMRVNEAVNLGYLGRIHQDLGLWEEAMENHREGLRIAREIGDRWNENYQLLQLGRLMLRIGEPVQARNYCAQALQAEFLETDYQATLMLGIAFLHLQSFSCAEEAFTWSVTRCETKLGGAPMLYMPSYTLAAALTCQAILDPRWIDIAHRTALLDPALTEYRRAMEITAVPSVVREAVRDLELIRAAGIEGLEPVFELLEGALNANTPFTKDSPDPIAV